MQICYYSIKYSNDYRGSFSNNSDFFKIVNEYKEYDEALENIGEHNSTVELLEHIQLLSNVQFDFQSLKIIQRFNRMYQILVEINNNSEYNQTLKSKYIDFSLVFKEITGFDLYIFVRIYYFIILLALSGKAPNIYNLVETLPLDVSSLGFSKDDILRVIIILSNDYKFYREYDNWNILKYYPVVKTNKKKYNYIISNMFSFVLCFPNIVYWIIRNYYKDQGSRDFTSYFGKCFEFYFDEVLDYYKISYNRIKEIEGKQTPDLRIETSKYIFIIEQKASLLPIAARVTTKEERFEAIEKYIDSTIIKAFNQLNEYNEETSKQIIRICLTFEKNYIEENIKAILKSNKQLMLKLNLKSPFELNWIVNIDDMEILMQILSDDEEMFNNLIERKIILENQEKFVDTSFETMIKGIKNDYTVNVLRHFNELEAYIRNNLKK